MNILLLGCGHMGSSLLNSWVSSNRYNIDVVDPITYKSKKKNFNSRVKFYKSLENIKNYSNFDFIILAIRPRDLKASLKQIKSLKLSSDIILASVIAGKKIKLFEKNLKNINYIVRVMPNMPALINQGMNCMVANKKIMKNDKNKIEKLFKYSGDSIWLKSENEIDMATAVSGSGPGYVFYLIDAMEKAAIKLGFSKTVAKRIVAQTFKGSINLLINNKSSAEDLVKSVATKGGTTEAGLNILQKNNVKKTFNELVKAAYKKAKLQGKK